ncbi:hypothetical protein OB962_18415 [Aeromonas piscicola]|uniref:Phage protein n=1 Tax=Aeromonas piscicola TaxID=600645 RepID=A0ABT7QGC4_9GAMM|nr:hypothetical protein [Aeromonas piscicola]MDM5132948.1 hypothetical protein [Aeromonas piscicola]
MKKHTSEPWFIDGQCAAAESDQVNNGFYTAICKGPDGEANARRIVACVNACRGLPTDELELNGLVSAVGNQLLDVEQHRDELLEALKEAVETIEWMYGCSSPARGEIEEAIREGNAAIAKAKGGDA